MITMFRKAEETHQLHVHKTSFECFQQLCATGTLVGALSSCAGILGTCSTIHSPNALIVLKWGSGRPHQCHSLGQDQSTEAQQAEKL